MMRSLLKLKEIQDKPTTSLSDIILMETTLRYVHQIGYSIISKSNLHYIFFVLLCLLKPVTSCEAQSLRDVALEADQEQVEFWPEFRK